MRGRFDVTSIQVETESTSVYIIHRFLSSLGQPIENMRSTSEEGEGERSNENGVDSKNSKQPQEWTLEKSSLWWLSSDLFQNPGNILIMSSIPFCFGAYYGYARPGNNLEEWISDLPKESASSKTVSAGTRAANKALEREAEIMASRQLGVHLAARALGVATLGTVGAFGALAGGEYMVYTKNQSSFHTCSIRCRSLTVGSAAFL